MAQDPDKKLIRVRGGLKGFRMISIADWKQEQREKNGKLPKVMSPRAKKQEKVRKRKNERKVKRKKQK